MAVSLAKHITACTLHSPMHNATIILYQWLHAVQTSQQVKLAAAYDRDDNAW